MSKLSLLTDNTVDVWTVEMLVDHLLLNNSPGTFDEFQAEPFEAVIAYHHTLGRYIRNSYQLWDDSQKQTLETLCRGRPEVSPDEASTSVMEVLWRRLRD